ncbi:MAG: hypothetical protein Q9195_006545 [Heterodermia aff. obscurata]
MFYASIGNTFCNVGTLISLTGVRAGQDSHICQFQSFMIQFFLPADALWNLAMAMNVYLTLFRKYNAEQLKALEWRYHIMCYGTTFVIALCYLLVDTSSRGKIYGPATLWCWIDIKWVALRIITCYGPAWICIMASFTIYLLAGREIFTKRKQLREFSNSNRPAYVAVENPFTSFKTTEVHVTSELADTPFQGTSSIVGKMDGTGGATSSPDLRQYSVTINCTPASPTIPSPSLRPKTWMSSTATSSHRVELQRRNNRAALEANTAAWGYTKCAILFFISLLVTWVPSSINRVYSLVYPERISVHFTYASAVVLPLMGFWNSVIYITTSWAACKSLLRNAIGDAAQKATVSRRMPRTIIESQPGLIRKARADSSSDSTMALAEP